MILKTRRNISKVVEIWVYKVGITGWALCNREKDEQFHAVQPRVYNKQTKRPVGGSFRDLNKKKRKSCSKAWIQSLPESCCQYLTIGRPIYLILNGSWPSKAFWPPASCHTSDRGRRCGSKDTRYWRGASSINESRHGMMWGHWHMKTWQPEHWNW